MNDPVTLLFVALVFLLACQSQAVATPGQVVAPGVAATQPADDKPDGLSLTDVQRLSGIDRARLSRLESDPHANPTIETLNRIAHALGVEVRVAIVDSR
jgi:hypothetical protein